MTRADQAVEKAGRTSERRPRPPAQPGRSRASNLAIATPERAGAPVRVTAA